MDDDNLYLEVTEEVTKGRIDPVLWAKAIAKARGDEDKGKYEYINLRVEQMKESSQPSDTPPGDERYMPPGSLSTQVKYEDPENEANTEAFSVANDEPAFDPDTGLNHTSDNIGGFQKLIQGRYGLAKTYWGFGFGIGLILYIISIAVGSAGSPTLAIIWILGLYTYTVIVWIAIWRSASRYSGPIIWSGLAKFAVILGILAAVGQLNMMFNP